MRIPYIIAGLCALAIIALGIVTWDMRVREPMIVKNESRNEGPLLIFGSIPYWNQPAAVAMFKKHVDTVDFLTVFWYRLDDNGAIVPYTAAREDPALVQYAHDNGVKVLALIANLPEDGDWDSERVQRVIESPDARRAHISAIVALLESKGFDGVNVDYEFLKDSQTAAYTAFVNELGAALHERGKILKVAIHAQRRGTETRGQDMVALAKGADYLGFMTYDQHWETSDPGANAEIGWMRDVLQYALQLGVPMNKVALGIPLDGYNWPKEDGEWGEADGIEYKDAVELADDEGAEIKYDKTVEAPYFEYGNSDGTENEVWFENLDSFIPKYNLAKEFGVAGLMLWKFGEEDERIYDVIP